MFDSEVIDADGHIIEPVNQLWDKYLEPEFRDRSIRVEVGADGLEILSVAGQRAAIAARPVLISAGAMGATLADLPALKQARGRILRGEIPPAEVGSAFNFGLDKTYDNMAGYGSMDARERLDLLNREGISKALLYPTLGVGIPAEMIQVGVLDTRLCAAYFRAYNRWLADFCRDSDGRLIPIALLDLSDPVEASLELQRAVKDGCKGACIIPFTFTRAPHGHPDHDRFFATVQDLDVPLGIHPNLDPPDWGLHHRYDNFKWPFFYLDLFSSHVVQHAFGTLLQFGVFDRFPKLRVVILESQAGWIGAFLDRADSLFKDTIFAADVNAKEPPSHYFKRQCFISADPDETTVSAIMPVVGEDKFFWASDYPHPDHPRDYMDNLKRMVAPMTEVGRRKILGGNVSREYKLS